ncbi:MAG: FAD binding domain-containing protein, partial [Gaiellaceae bacterium]
TLSSITAEPSSIHVGATARQVEFEASSAVRAQIPVAAAALPYIGHFVTRNRGTIGGSLAHADARGELPLLLVALGGSVAVASRDRGQRDIPAEELFVTHFTTSLESDELLVSSSWPTATDGWRFSFEEFAQRHGDYALGMVCVGMQVIEGTIRAARIAVSAVTDRPVCLDDAGELLGGQEPSPELARAAGAMARSAVDPHDDLHASAQYRKNLTGVLVERACHAAFGAAG